MRQSRLELTNCMQCSEPCEPCGGNWNVHDRPLCSPQCVRARKTELQRARRKKARLLAKQGRGA